MSQSYFTNAKIEMVTTAKITCVTRNSLTRSFLSDSEKLQKTVIVDFKNTLRRRLRQGPGLCRPKVRGRFAFPSAQNPRIYSISRCGNYPVFLLEFSCKRKITLSEKTVLGSLFFVHNGTCVYLRVAHCGCVPPLCRWAADPSRCPRGCAAKASGEGGAQPEAPGRTWKLGHQLHLGTEKQDSQHMPNPPRGSFLDYLHW